MQTISSLKQFGKLSLLVAILIFSAQNSKACFFNCSVKKDKSTSPSKETVVSGILYSLAVNDLECDREGYASNIGRAHSASSYADSMLNYVSDRDFKMTISPDRTFISFSRISGPEDGVFREVLFEIDTDVSGKNVTRFVRSYYSVEKRQKNVGSIINPQIEEFEVKHLFQQQTCATPIQE